jgi:hypothetical protein
MSVSGVADRAGLGVGRWTSPTIAPSVHPTIAPSVPTSIHDASVHPTIAPGVPTSIHDASVHPTIAPSVPTSIHDATVHPAIAPSVPTSIHAAGIDPRIVSGIELGVTSRVRFFRGIPAGNRHVVGGIRRQGGVAAEATAVEGATESGESQERYEHSCDHGTPHAPRHVGSPKATPCHHRSVTRNLLRMMPASVALVSGLVRVGRRRCSSGVSAR